MEEEEENHEEREVEVLPCPPSWTHLTYRATKPFVIIDEKPNSDHPSVDLSLSMSSIGSPPGNMEKVRALKKQTAEQIRLADIERAYAERVRELTRRELDIAEREFARARAVWERARQEVERVEKMKEVATRRISSTCLEITCHACRRQFRPL